MKDCPICKKKIEYFGYSKMQTQASLHGKCCGLTFTDFVGLVFYMQKDMSDKVFVVWTFRAGSFTKPAKCYLTYHGMQYDDLALDFDITEERLKKIIVFA